MTRFQKRLSFSLSVPTYLLAIIFLSIYIDSPLPIISIPIVALGWGIWVLSNEFIQR